MPKKTKRPVQAEPRPDLIISDNEFIAQTRRPNLDRNRKQFVLDGYARGLSLESLQRGSGYDTAYIKKLLNLDEFHTQGE